MKPLFTILSLVLCSEIFGQSCSCDQDSLNMEYSVCDTTKFDNNSMLYWNYNCDSTWLTFENSSKIKKVINSLGEGMAPMIGKLGYVYFLEYHNAFLVLNKLASGCCFPPDFYLYDKSNGNLKTALGRLLYYSQDPRTPFVIGIANSNCDTASLDYNALIIYNVDNGKEYKIKLSEKKLKEQ